MSRVGDDLTLCDEVGAPGRAAPTSLDPQIAGMIEELDSGFPRVHTMTGAQARATIRARFVPSAQPEEVGAVSDQTIATADGPIQVRIYRPAITVGVPPILVYGHGGGFVFCDLDSHDGLCRSFANLIPAVAVSVAYRLTPEHRWPAAAEDVYAVANWADPPRAFLRVAAESRPARGATGRRRHRRP